MHWAISTRPRSLLGGLPALVLAAGLVCLAGAASGDFTVLAFDKTAGFRHSAQINAGKIALARLAAANGFEVSFTDDESDLDAASLASVDVVLFLFTSGDILSPAREADFEQFILAGGGFVGIHSATDTEYDWAFYGELVGAYFSNHPAIQDATLHVVDDTHPSTSHLAPSFSHNEEWYNFESNPAQNLELDILLEVDESTYSGGQHGASHPVAWTRTMGAGRSWYTALGHTFFSDADWQTSFFDQHVLGGIQSVVSAPEPGTGAMGWACIAALFGLARVRAGRSAGWIESA